MSEVAVTFPHRRTFLKRGAQCESRSETSGGRGEYEVAGSHEAIRVHDVFDREIVLSFSLAFGSIRTTSSATHKASLGSGYSDPHADSHVYLILAAILLLPKPKREIGATPGGKTQIYKDNFSVMSIPFDVVELTSSEIVVSPTQIILSNSSLDSRQARCNRAFAYRNGLLGCCIQNKLCSC